MAKGGLNPFPKDVVHIGHGPTTAGDRGLCACESAGMSRALLPA